MRLKSVRVTEFKSIRDSGDFETGDVTCLVGKNEAGKTAVLEALYRLHPVVDSHSHFDVTNDYPRTEVEDYQHAVQTGKRKHARAITAVYELSDGEIAAVEADFGTGIFTNRLAELWRGYENKTYFDINIDEAIAVQHLIGQTELTDEIRATVAQAETIKGLLAGLTSAASNQDTARNAALAAANQLDDATAKAKAIDDANRLQESASAKQLRSDIATYTKESFKKHIWTEYLDDKLPKFLYFDEYYQMEGQVNVQKLKERQASGALTESDRPMLGLIELSRLNVDQLLAAKDTQALLNKIEGASNHLSKQILKYWSQNKHILVRFDLRPALAEDPEGMREGTNLWGFVHDTKHLATTRLGTRSRGFIWFFSFLAWFSQQRKRDIPLILLLDEPGLFLHASAQDDLLRYIEQELKPHHQVIYTTHSPFMVDPKDFSRVRIVRDKSMESDDELPPEQQGTKVFTDVLEADDASLFPLQGALGYDIAQTLFIGPNCLIVEGVSDLLYLPIVSGVLADQKRVGLSEDWMITPVGGSDKVTTFVSLLGSQKKLKLATLIDFSKKDQQTIENLYKKKLLAKKNVHTFAQYAGQTEADIEDMFDREFYIDLVNEEYRNELSKKIEMKELGNHPRILVNIEEWLKANPLKAGSFNHYRPARYFAENIRRLVAKVDNATLDRFEQAFKALNALLKTGR
jgi:predicted ATP-dependent endonuclease of OLD family